MRSRWVLLPREAPDPRARMVVPLVAALLALLAGAVLFRAGGAPPFQALLELFRGPLTGAFGLSETLRLGVPLGLCGLSVGLARRVGLWNIGAEGQLFMGAWFASALALQGPPLPAALAVLVAVGAGAAGGALWAALPALLRVRRGVSEILSTLLLNYTALAWVELWVYGAWKGPDGFPFTAFFAEAWRIPALPVGQGLHLGLGLPVLLALAMSLVYRRTVWGHELRVIAASPEAARYAGLPVAARQVAVFAAAGALAGLAGAMEVLGVQHRLHASISSGYGYTAILAAFLAGTAPGWTVVAALGLAALQVGGEGLRTSWPGVSAATVQVFQGVLFGAILAGSGLSRFRLVPAERAR